MIKQEQAGARFNTQKGDFSHKRPVEFLTKTQQWHKKHTQKQGETGQVLLSFPVGY